MEKEKQNREELFKLMSENSDLPVVLMVNFEIISDDNCINDFSFLGSLGKVKIAEYTVGKYCVWFKDNHYGNMIETLEDCMFDISPLLGDKQLNNCTVEESKQLYNNLKWTKAIIVNIIKPEDYTIHKIAGFDKLSISEWRKEK